MEADTAEEAPQGFAEALFGGAKARTSPVPVTLFEPAVDVEEYDEQAFLDGPLPGLHSSAAEDYDSDLDSPPAPNRFLVWLLVIVVAAVLAGVAAHLNGTAFWQLLKLQAPRSKHQRSSKLQTRKSLAG